MQSNPVAKFFDAHKNSIEINIAKVAQTLSRYVEIAFLNSYLKWRISSWGTAANFLFEEKHKPPKNKYVTNE